MRWAHVRRWLMMKDRFFEQFGIFTTAALESGKMFLIKQQSITIAARRIL